jgi:chlorite dismutase
MTSEHRTASSSSDAIHAGAHGHGAPQGGHGHGASGSHGGHGGSTSHGGGEGLPAIDVSERGAEREGRPQVMDRRLFMQFLAFHTSAATPRMGVESLASAFTERRIAAVVYEDVNDPRGIGVLTWSENPAHFVTAVRPLLGDAARGLTLRPELTMLGRTYSSGYEQDLNFWLLDRPQQTVLNPAHDWAVWYPLRRSGAFARLEPREQGGILREHATIGRAYGEQDLAHDVRLACHGLDARDNEFVIGLVGKNLHPLSHIVQTMRKTRQTSEFISQMGPFFVGHVAWRNAATAPGA